MTRRGILAVVNSIYDPLGLLAPVILPAKLLLKDLCKEQSGWDEDISEKHAEDWKGWTEDVTYLSNFQVNRVRLWHRILPVTGEQARQEALFLVMGKSRVASLKQVTIPRLELTAAVVAVKIDKMLHQELQVPLQPSTFWTDSTTVLRYIDNDTARFKTFVANRINVIREATKPSQWKYVRTTENPADLPSRGLKAKSLAQSRTWIDGPSFLLNNECDWPEQPMQRKESLQNDPEVKNTATVNTIQVEEDKEPMNKLIDYYSEWHKLKRAVAWILKLKRTLQQLKDERKELSRTIIQAEKDPERQRSKLEHHMKKYKSTREKKPLTLDDLVAAESEIIKFSQRQQFNEELQALQKGKQVSRNSQLFRLDPILQDSILRVGGRLNKSAMPETAKRPAIISKHSRVATLILSDIHQRTGHAGRSYVLAQLRRKYWIPQANSAIRKLLNKCVVCRRITGKVGEQKMANLPEDRLLPDKPHLPTPALTSSGPFDVKRGGVQSRDTACCSPALP
ncbi:hypothetical protein AAFF_G00065720 [Aldrovandia affinis]|uniref:Integrase zinc-binding domain-containing protein n=1 Tax=Aldrovandia affinis TaxID=143900 RepID=A0AAD7T3W4_9TELE|nr:hypothetical protein AAFF_G00065720 [Aldrovandia affinis]